MLVVDPDGWLLQQPERAFDILAWVRDVSAYEQATGCVFPSNPDVVAVPRLVVTRSDRVPSEQACQWWRSQVRDALGESWFGSDDDDPASWPEERLIDEGYADALAWAAEQLMTEGESANLQGWLRREYGSVLHLERRLWSKLDSEGWFDDWAPPGSSWALDQASSYPMPFAAVAEPHWLLLERPEDRR